MSALYVACSLGAMTSCSARGTYPQLRVDSLPLQRARSRLSRFSALHTAALSWESPIFRVFYTACFHYEDGCFGFVSREGFQWTPVPPASDRNRRADPNSQELFHQSHDIFKKSRLHWCQERFYGGRPLHTLLNLTKGIYESGDG